MRYFIWFLFIFYGQNSLFCFTFSAFYSNTLFCGITNKNSVSMLQFLSRFTTTANEFSTTNIFVAINIIFYYDYSHFLISLNIIYIFTRTVKSANNFAVYVFGTQAQY